MAAYKIDVSSPGADPMEHKCTCGCVPCAETCCSLDCIERPRFFCGQLLTDQDLTALVDWTRDKLRLNRFRDGWGVVCGFDVRSDPKNRAGVIIGPGYALSCCGDDLVACEDFKLDLSGVCKNQNGPCPPCSKKDGEEETVVNFGGVPVPESQVRRIDLYIAYEEQLADPQTALGRSACKEAAACEYGRVNEGVRVSWLPAIQDVDPWWNAASAWKDKYDQCAELLQQLKGVNDPKNVKATLCRWIDRHPLQEFAFLQNWICQLTDSDALPPELVFWLVQDCRNAFLRCACHACDASSGVPLARVWLHANPDGGRNERCNVLRIDSYPPYRRPLQRDCWPAPFGMVNLGQVIWHTPEEARLILVRLGLQVGVDVEFATLADVSSLWDDGLFALPADSISLRIMKSEFGERVVGVAGAKGPWADIKPPAKIAALKSTAEPADFKKISGIGDKTAAKLTDSGIKTFKQLADASLETLKGLFPALKDDVLNQWKDAARTEAG
ncbi:MAG: hypothetical protein HY270_18410 [Deltaproteobacteria bacterium]|nr:hypothetical protein [Deltaproteobacteria bacterium]